MEMPGFEPGASRMRNGRSTTELHPLWYTLLDKRCNICQYDKWKSTQNDLRQPGIEPGSIAWKATMLTFTPPTLSILKSELTFIFIYNLSEIVSQMLKLDFRCLIVL